MGLDTVDLLKKIEDNFSINIPDSEAEQIFTVQDIYEAVARHLRGDSEPILAIKLKINNIIADYAGVDLSNIEPHKSITDDLGLD